ncbi:MAG TPA: hypothetical protein PK402_00365, partial [Tepidisphaeraceae bacterium]|nr:hypothetical protein [Tepidisphaeraceae bacterium]
MSISKTNRLDPRAVKANCRSVRRVSSATWLESLEHRRLLATFTVTNTIDAGTGSLRQALVNANATAASDTILFNIPGTGPHTIAPISQLPLITQPVVIDATSEVLPNGTRGIELDGSLAGLADGLIIQSGNVTVRGLVINQFSDSGIKFISNVGTQNGLVTGCYIGTDPTGMMALGNGGDGIEMTQSSGVIGGALASERNIISANGDRGVRVTGSLAGITLVIGNYIGVAADGVTDLGNAQHGVQLSSSDNRVGGAGGQRNVISGNGGDGVRIERQIFGAQFGPEANENTVVGNYIGTDVTGEIAIRNEFQGVHIINGSGNTIGGAETGLRNVISGNRRRGVTITAVSALNLAGFSQNNVVIGNYIGLSASGAAMGNLRSG